MTIRELVTERYVLARQKGRRERPAPAPERIALIRSEASEALEQWRENKPLSYVGSDGEPEGLASEYADILIRIGRYCGVLDIDPEAEIERKLAYNRTRPYRRGDELA